MGGGGWGVGGGAGTVVNGSQQLIKQVQTRHL